MDKCNSYKHNSGAEKRKEKKKKLGVIKKGSWTLFQVGVKLNFDSESVGNKSISDSSVLVHKNETISSCAYSENISDDSNFASESGQADSSKDDVHSQKCESEINSPDTFAIS